MDIRLFEQDLTDALVSNKLTGIIMGDWFFSLFSGLSALLSGVGPFFLLLGILIFIHEAGHFLVARWCGVRVEVFSLGFGPKLLKYKKGDTVYCLSAFPLGGYVKMFGDNPLAPPPEEERHLGFLFKKVPQKLAIAFAGPLMNLLFAFFALQFLFFSGVSSFAPILGDAPENSLVYKKGLRSGDKLTLLNGRPAPDGPEIEKLIRKSAGRKISMEALSPSGESKRLIFTPEEKANENLLYPAKTIGRIEGFTFASKGTRIGISSWDSPAFQAGLRTFDEIQSLQPQFVDKALVRRDAEGAFSASAEDVAAEKSSAASFGAAAPESALESVPETASKAVSAKAVPRAGLETAPRAVRYWRELEPALASFVKQGASSAVFTVLRPIASSKKAAAGTAKNAENAEGAKARLEIAVPLNPSHSSLKKEKILEGLGLEKPDLYIHKVGRGTPAASAGLKRGDKITAAGGLELSGFKEFAQIVQGIQGKKPSQSVFSADSEISSDNASGKETGGGAGSGSVSGSAGGSAGGSAVAGGAEGARLSPQKALTPDPAGAGPQGPALRLSVMRDGGALSVSVQPKKMLSEGAAKERIMVGVVSASHIVFPQKILRRFGFWASGLEAGAQTLFLLKSITISLGRLIKGSVSVRHLAGPVGIGRAAHRSFQEGGRSFIFMMALISLSLFYMNLLPVPLLDGGHILFFAVEGILGRPLSVKKLILAQRAGLAAVLSFFALAFVNDIYNWLTAW